MAAVLPNVSQDLIWEVARKQNSFIVKRKGLGKDAIFSRDPLNLKNIHSKKYAGFAQDKAIGVQAGEKGTVKITSKNVKKAQKPAENLTSFTYSSANRKSYKSVANLAASRSYRSDLRQVAVERVSAVRRSEKAYKEVPESKPRGKKAQNTDEA
ncbi:60S ribosomal protein L28, partial [Plectosphaerella plurivora]